MTKTATILKYLALSVAGMTSTAALADEGYNHCMESAMTSLAMSDCASDWNKRAERRLAENWRLAMDTLEGKNTSAGKLLLGEQRAWIKFKDLSCDFYRGVGFGSLHRSVIGPSCRNEIIEARAKQLAQIAAPLCDGGC